jgi:2-iminobutanoate/2-iminopropanoate deaminase
MSTQVNIERSNPEVGYLANEVFKTFAFTQTIKAGNTLYFSGVAPQKGDLKNMQLVGEGDMHAQVEWTLEVLKRCLAQHGATFHNLVAETIYTTNIEDLLKVMDVCGRFFGEDSPTSTLVEVKRLFHPQQMVEITGIAVLE